MIVTVLTNETVMVRANGAASLVAALTNNPSGLRVGNGVSIVDPWLEVAVLDAAYSFAIESTPGLSEGAVPLVGASEAPGLSGGAVPLVGSSEAPGLSGGAVPLAGAEAPSLSENEVLKAELLEEGVSEGTR
jgi:hypothetical protein